MSGSDLESFPGIFSVDDHIVEPPDLWQSRLPDRYRDIGPRVARERLGKVSAQGLNIVAAQSDDGDWADVWYYENYRQPFLINQAAAGIPSAEISMRAVTFDDIRPGCWKPMERLADMDRAGIETSLCFPNMIPTRFCGQVFLEASDKALAALCVRAYNDFILDEWCAPSGGRLVPLGIVPLWDPDLAAQEVRLMAARGMRAFCFSEAPKYLGLPSIHSGHWDPFFAACEETGSVVMIHVGSSSHVAMPSDDAPHGVSTLVLYGNSAATVVDWLFSGLFVRYPGLKVCLAESQIGWLPFYLEQIDDLWEVQRGFLTEVREKVPERPSTYFRSNMYAAFFNDVHGLRNLDQIGAENVLVETDFPHTASTWPESKDVLRKQTEAAGLSRPTVEKLMRGNARKLFRLDEA